MAHLAVLISASLLASSDSGNSVKSTVGDISSNQDQIILALIAIIGTSVAALVYTIRNNTIAKGASEQVRQVNNAVNNIGPGEHRLYDKVDRIEKSVSKLEADQEEFDSHGWENLPPDLNNAVMLTSTIRDLQNHHESLNEKLDTILAEIILIRGELKDHVKWEMEAKYGFHGS